MYIYKTDRSDFSWSHVEKEEPGFWYSEVQADMLTGG